MDAELRRIRKEGRELDHKVLNCAFVWMDLNGSDHEAEWKEKLIAALTERRHKAWEENRYRIEHGLD